ncbi:1,4-alpha-glucan branching protein GlgB [Saccharopolyspora rosea]|uniref:1,4-alpha-glucan branching enzyme GlgB n=1 Tax=Saccharopolyspora rosea TaxID=524884 RepID=A0ABW3FVF3_9PSEU|nr:1,4-alpha-glucan branching protein GlgB [Saccharopolyspora rosea]
MSVETSGPGELDLHLIGEGRHERLWTVLGAHRRGGAPDDPTTGVSFAVWAPNARQVQVRGDFTRGAACPLRRLAGSGVWEVFVPGVADGARYRFDVLGADGRWRTKADPVAFAVQPPPDNSSVVFTSEHTWHDADWIARRARAAWQREPISVYEVHAGSWSQGLDFRELAHRLADHVTDAGFTHVELLPVTAHPFGGSWGYQVTSYFAPTPWLGSPDDLRYLVDHLHGRGVGVLLDWVPGHFPRDEWALARFDGTPLYEHPDPRRADHPEWGTLTFDFGRPEVRNFLLASALHWIEEFHADGLRVDAVTSMLYLDYARQDGQWLPNEHGGRENLDAVRFLRELNEAVHRNHPGVLVIAEEATAWPGVTSADGGLGFDLKWNMGWMHDTLSHWGRDLPQRRAHSRELVDSVSYAFSERFVLALSHDEVVHGKGSLWGRMPGSDRDKAACLRSLLAFTWAYPGKKLLFMGGEFGQVREWSHERSLDRDLLADPLHAGAARLTAELNAHYRRLPALHTQDLVPAGFEWIDDRDPASGVLSFLRWGSDGSVLACVVNSGPDVLEHYRVGLPRSGRWREVLNTDARSFGGDGATNPGAVEAVDLPWQGRPASAAIRLPRCGVVWLVPDEPV